jgi:hypothetical protein
VIGGTAERHIGHHHAIFDRMSHLVPHYRTFVRASALSGAWVVNNPLVVSDDKFYALSLAARLGLHVPRAVLLPQKAYGPGFDPSTSLHNLEYPLRWAELGHYVGFPATLRPARANGMRAEPIADGGGLVAAFDRTWDSPTMVQADVLGVVAEWRCFVAGDQAVVVDLGMAAEPKAEHQKDEAAEAAVRVSRGLGLSFNVVDVQVTAERVWVVDAVDPLPHLAPHVLGAECFDKLMDRLASHLIDLARRGAPPIVV